MRAVVFTALVALVACGGTRDTGSTLPPDPGAVRDLSRGARLLSEGRLTPAARRLTRATTRDPNLWEAHYDLALVHMRRGELAEAEASLAEVRRLAPEAGEPLFAAAHLAVMQGDLSRASSLLGDLLERAPDDRRVRLTLARVQRRDEEFADALTTLRELLVRDPRDVDALVEVGRVYRAQEEYEVARLVLEKARGLVQVREGAGEPDETERAARLAEIANEHGLLELARDDTQAAFEAFEAAIAAQASFLPARLNMGAVMVRAGNYAGARVQYDAALELAGDNLAAQLGRAVALRGLGEHRQARRAYRRILEAEPEHPDALLDLAILQAEFVDERAQSRETFQRFLDAAPRGHSGRELAERYLQDIPAPGDTGAQ